MKNSFRIAQKVTPFIPRALRDWVRLHIPMTEYDLQRRIAQNPYADITNEVFAESSICLGIFQDLWQTHKYYIAACKEMRISYVVLDLLADDWIEQASAARCDAFLIWPSNFSTIYKGMFDNRLYILEQELKKLIYPTWKECWLTEHKPRLRDWLIANDILHPKTWVAYQKSDAMDLISQMDFPVVGKSATGASGKGVRILKDARELHDYVDQIFGKGISLRGLDPDDKHRGYVFLQEYLPNIEEWRLVRIGDSFFGHRKGTSTRGLHSGASSCYWEDPGEDKLNLLREITDKHHFKSMDMDIFVTKDGRMLINELQTTFGCSVATTQMKINGIEGRYLYEEGGWKFEPGDFCRNHICNLRISYLLNHISNRREI